MIEETEASQGEFSELLWQAWFPVSVLVTAYPAGGEEGGQCSLCHLCKWVQFEGDDGAGLLEHFVNLFSPLAVILFHQQTTAQKNTLATTDWEKISNVSTSRDLSFNKTEPAPLLRHTGSSFCF